MELMTLAEINEADHFFDLSAGLSAGLLIDKLVATARAAHEYKAEVERLNVELNLHIKSGNNKLVEILELRSIIAKLEERIAAHTRPATDWRSE